MQRRIDLLRVTEGIVVCNQTAIEPGSGITQARQIKSQTGRMLYGYLGPFGMRGFKPSPNRATAGDYEIVATVLPDGGSVQLMKKGSKDAIAEIKLDAAPIQDGLAIANGKLFVSLENGKVLCLR